MIAKPWPTLLLLFVVILAEFFADGEAVEQMCSLLHCVTPGTRGRGDDDGVVEEVRSKRIPNFAKCERMLNKLIFLSLHCTHKKNDTTSDDSGNCG